MLKSLILYLPGTGGSFLQRVLTLSEKTITGTGGDDVNEYQTQISAADRLSRYLQWGGQGVKWKHNESRSRYGYVLGINDWVNYEDSPLWFIEKWHPFEYRNFTEQGLLGTEFFQSIINIQVTDEHKKFLLDNQQSKQYTLDWNKDHYELDHIMKAHADIPWLTIPFSSFFKQQEFLDNIEKINQELDLELNMNYVEQLWQRWFAESTKVWTIGQ
jgi:hypothetical protein